MAETPAELAEALRALRGSIVAVGRPRRVATGQWYVRVRAHQPLIASAPPPVSTMRLPRALVVVIAAGGVAVVALLVMATAWAVHHWAATLCVLALSGWAASRLQRGRMHR